MESASPRSSSVTPLERSTSQLSTASAMSGRGHTMRTRSRQRVKITSHPSSSASSVAASDKSLTSFPSFSPESPRDGNGRPFFETFSATANDTIAANKRKASNPQSINSIVDSLTSTDTPTPKTPRNALFEDTPLSTNRIPGALHLADDDHIQRLITRHGAANLVRQVAEDLAQRDVQITNLRRRNDERERALRRIILECGLSSLDLEKRLREVEAELKAQDQSKKGGLSDMMNDAMEGTVAHGNPLSIGINDATIRAINLSASKDNGGTAPGTMRGWKDWIMGTGTGKRNSRTSSINGDVTKAAARGATMSDRRPLEDLFTPPGTESVRSSSRASSIYSGQAPRKPSSSLANMALQLVAGKNTGRDGDSIRGRPGSAGQGGGGSLRTASATSVRTNASNRAVSTHVGPKALMAMRRATPAPVNNIPRSRPQERWDSGGASPPSPVTSRPDNSGPLEMDTIFSPEGQPPILTHVYNNHAGSEFLTDTFGFIYDQRRKKRQKEAAQIALQMKRGSRTEMLTGKTTISPNLIEDDVKSLRETGSIERPDSPFSIDEVAEQGRPKRWQDYLKIATFPTELLSHTPSMTATTLEVFEGTGSQSPGQITSEQRGFVPPANTTAAVNDETAASETSKSAEETPTTALSQEDTEPVKILLDQLNEVHDALQREKTFKWNEFQRKVRAERRREGEAAAAAATAAAEARYQQAPLILPEAKLADGELIGIADLGVKGKVGRNKWMEFRNLVLGGIPVALRPKIWSEGCGATFKRIPGYYAELVAKGSDGLDPATITDIDRDIDRTLRDNIFFLRGPGVQKLHEVLIAYARRNPNVGYCQGMNLIAANLLLIVPSTEETFWILTCMIERMLPEGYFDHSLIASRADQQVLRQYVSQVLPKLSQHLESMYIDLETLTFQWFLSIFTDCLSAEALFRVWDVVLCSNDGSTFLFQVALALLKLNERQLLACVSPSDIYSYINRQMTNHAISIDGLIQASDGLRKEVKREDVESKREKAIEAEKKSMREREEQREARLGTKALSAPAIITPETASAVPSPAHSPLLLQGEDSISVADLRDLDENRELTVHTSMPIEEEVGLGLG